MWIKVDLQTNSFKNTKTRYLLATMDRGIELCDVHTFVPPPVQKIGQN